MSKQVVNTETIISQIYLVRGQRVMLDSDLAAIYGVETWRVNEQVKRNRKKFPPDFIFQLTRQEFSNLISQNARSSWGGRRTLPYAFTEHGAVMAATVLNSEVAIETSIFVVRAFVQIRGMLSAYKDLEQRMSELEKSTKEQFKDHDDKIDLLFSALRDLMGQKSERKPIGFQRNSEEK